MQALPRLRDCGNLLLDRLPAEEYDALSPRLRRATLALKEVVHEYGADVESVHFPTTGLISLLTVLEEDDPVEAATIAREGMLGAPAALGVAKSPHRAICQKPARPSGCRSATSARRWAGPRRWPAWSTSTPPTRSG
jgi:hypothetical protein